MSLAWDVVTGSRGYSVPAGWTVRRVGDLVKLTNGFPFPSDRFGPSGDMPLVRIRDLAGAEFETFVTGPVSPEFVIADGDVVIGMDGDFNLKRWNRGPAALNQRMCLLRPREGVDIRFVEYALPSILSIINDLTFATTVKHLSSSDVLGERIALPPLEEQRRIADFLDAETSRIDRLVGASLRFRETLLERRAAGELLRFLVMARSRSFALRESHGLMQLPWSGQRFGWAWSPRWVVATRRVGVGQSGGRTAQFLGSRPVKLSKCGTIASKI